MTDFSFRISPNIFLGTYSTSRLGEFALNWGSKYMLLLDPVLREVGLSDKISQSLSDRKIDFITFDQIPECADSKVIEQALTLAKEAHVHGVIAVGGCKVLNAARALCAVFNEVHPICSYLDEGVPTTAPLSLICVPTTIRAPFIFTDKIPVIDARSQQIKIIHAQPSLCKLALFDPNLSSTLTENQTSSMAIESLALALEAYLSQKANFFSDMLCEKAGELLGYAMDGSGTLNITTPQEELLSQGGCMASLAIGSSSIGVAGLLALTINARFKISRSLVTAILLPYVIEDYAKFKSERIEKFARIFRVEESDDICAAFADNMRQRIAKANLPARLKELSISIEQLTLAIEDAGKLELMNSLPRSMTTDNLFELIKLAY
ncbi:MAG: iron-containing alcohol dehydrogenase [Treponema sp.]|nr:iron-containing alcohol dehydrogenase [Treponema sp.]